MEERLKRSLYSFSETLILTFLCMFFLAQSFRIDGYSMEPTLYGGQRILVEKVSCHLGGPRRGDIIVFQNPANPKQSFVKRVIGIGGDEIVILDSKIYLNGELLQEQYINEPTEFPKGTRYLVPPNHYFVLGDNRNHSADSRFFGSISKNFIIGRSLIIYWPFDNFRWLF